MEPYPTSETGRNHWAPRPTTYRGTRMRSRLEAGYASWLDWCGFDWQYEPEAFASGVGQYLPDFRLSRVVVVGEPALRTVYVEVKPRIAVELGVDPALGRRMLAITDSEPEAVLLVQSPHDENDENDPAVTAMRILRIPEWASPIVPDYVETQVQWVWREPGAPPGLAEAMCAHEAGPWISGWWNGSQRSRVAR